MRVVHIFKLYRDCIFLIYIGIAYLWFIQVLHTFKLYGYCILLIYTGTNEQLNITMYHCILKILAMTPIWGVVHKMRNVYKVVQKTFFFYMEHCSLIKGEIFALWFDFKKKKRERSIKEAFFKYNSNWYY